MHEDLIFWDKVCGIFDRWRKPAYRIIGPSADREYLYREGERYVFVCFDYVVGSDIDQVVYANGINHWEPPYEKEAISSEKRDEIIERLGANLKAGKSRYKIQ